MENQEYEGEINKVPTKTIYLNICKLEKGEYTLKIMHKHKILKQMKFNK